MRLMPHHVLMTTDAVGGVWRYALDLARELRGQGVETTLLGMGPHPDADQVREAERAARLRWAELPLDWAARDEAQLRRVPDAIAEAAADVGADMIHVNVPSQAAGLETDAPVVAAAHSCVATWFRAVRRSALPPEWRWQKRLTEDGLRAAAVVVAPSRAHARLIAECYDSASRIEVVPNATLLGPAAEVKRPRAYAAARWWDEGKAADVLDAAAARLDFALFAAGSTVGPGGQRQEFRHARHLGQLDRVRLFDLAASAAAFVSPSRYEPFGLAALEAARVGAALVLSDIPTYRELWDGAALFVPVDDPDALAASVRRAVDDEGLRRMLAQSAAERSLRFSARAQAERMLAIYGRVARPHEAVGVN